MDVIILHVVRDQMMIVNLVLHKSYEIVLYVLVAHTNGCIQIAEKVFFISILPIQF